MFQNVSSHYHHPHLHPPSDGYRHVWKGSPAHTPASVVSSDDTTQKPSTSMRAQEATGTGYQQFDS